MRRGLSGEWAVGVRPWRSCWQARHSGSGISAEWRPSCNSTGQLSGLRAWIIPVLALAFVLMCVYFLQRILDRLGINLVGLLAHLGIIHLP